MPADIASLIELWRGRLLDTSKRNRLISGFGTMAVGQLEKAAHIDLKRSEAVGVRLLLAYLDFAQRGAEAPPLRGHRGRSERLRLAFPARGRPGAGAARAVGPFPDRLRLAPGRRPQDQPLLTAARLAVISGRRVSVERGDPRWEGGRMVGGFDGRVAVANRAGAGVGRAGVWPESSWAVASSHDRDRRWGKRFPHWSPGSATSSTSLQAAYQMSHRPECQPRDGCLNSASMWAKTEPHDCPTVPTRAGDVNSKTGPWLDRRKDAAGQETCGKGVRLGSGPSGLTMPVEVQVLSSALCEKRTYVERRESFFR